MTLAAPPTTAVVAELLDPPDGKLYELIDGDLAEKMMSFLSVRAATNVASRLDAFVGFGERGWVLNAMTLDCFMWRERYMRRPDVCYVSRSRLPAQPSDAFLTIAPDLCVEVVLPNDHASDRESKTEDYFRAGVVLVWHVYPVSRTIHVYHRDGGAAVLREGKMLTGGDVLPGFAVAVTDLFPPRPA